MISRGVFHLRIKNMDGKLKKLKEKDKKSFAEVEKPMHVNKSTTESMNHDIHDACGLKQLLIFTEQQSMQTLMN